MLELGGALVIGKFFLPDQTADGFYFGIYNYFSNYYRLVCWIALTWADLHTRKKIERMFKEKKCNCNYTMEQKFIGTSVYEWWFDAWAPPCSYKLKMQMWAPLVY